MFLIKTVKTQLKLGARLRNSGGSAQWRLKLRAHWLQEQSTVPCHAVNPSMGAPLRHPCLRGAGNCTSPLHPRARQLQAAIVYLFSFCRRQIAHLAFARIRGSQGNRIAPCVFAWCRQPLFDRHFQV